MAREWWKDIPDEYKDEEQDKGELWILDVNNLIIKRGKLMRIAEEDADAIVNLAETLKELEERIEKLEEKVKDMDTQLVWRGVIDA